MFAQMEIHCSTYRSREKTRDLAVFSVIFAPTPPCLSNKCRFSAKVPLIFPSSCRKVHLKATLRS